MNAKMDVEQPSRETLIEDLLQVVRESLNGRTEQELLAVMHTIRGVASGDTALPMLRGSNGAVVAFVRPGVSRGAVASDLYELAYAIDDRWTPAFRHDRNPDGSDDEPVLN